MQLPNLVAAPGKPPAPGLGSVRFTKMNRVLVIGEWNQDVPTQAIVNGQPIRKLEIILRIKSKCFAAQLGFGGENAFAGIDLP